MIWSYRWGSRSLFDGNRVGPLCRLLVLEVCDMSTRQKSLTGLQHASFTPLFPLWELLINLFHTAALPQPVGVCENAPGGTWNRTTCCPHPLHPPNSQPSPFSKQSQPLPFGMAGVCLTGSFCVCVHVCMFVCACVCVCMSMCHLPSVHPQAMVLHV